MPADDGPLAPGWRRGRFGEAVVTVIADGVRPGPGPHPTFGSDQEAEAARSALALRAADEGMAVMAYHLPFPGLGYVIRDGETFRYLPESVQDLTDTL